MILCSRQSQLFCTCHLTGKTTGDVLIKYNNSFLVRI